MNMFLSDDNAKRSAFAGFRHIAPLSGHEDQFVDACIPCIGSVNAGHEIARIGSPLNRPKFLVSGWVGLVRQLDDGRRQIVDLHIAGDPVAFDFRLGARAKASYVCLTPVRYMEAGELIGKALEHPDEFPSLVAGLHAIEDEAHARLFANVVRAGQMFAQERIAHLALDLYRRHDRIGLCLAHSFPMPLSQEILGDVLGLSTVHVNRTLQQMRRESSLKATPGRWQLSDMESLTETASGSRPRHRAQAATPAYS